MNLLIRKSTHLPPTVPSGCQVVRHSSGIPGTTLEPGSEFFSLSEQSQSEASSPSLRRGAPLPNNAIHLLHRPFCSVIEGSESGAGCRMCSESGLGHGCGVLRKNPLRTMRNTGRDHGEPSRYTGEVPSGCIAVSNGSRFIGRTDGVQGYPLQPASERELQRMENRNFKGNRIDPYGPGNLEEDRWVESVFRKVQSFRESSLSAAAAPGPTGILTNYRKIPADYLSTTTSDR